MLVRDIMSTTNVPKVKPTTPVNEVVELLHKSKAYGLPVVSDAGIVVGLITENELFSMDSKLYLPAYIQLLRETEFIIGGHKTLPYAAGQIAKSTAADIMNKDVYFASPDLPAEKLAEVFLKRQINFAPVTDAANLLWGVVSTGDLMRMLITSENPDVKVVDSLPHKRPVDDALSYVHSDLNSRFAYVTKARANIWLTTAVILFIIGFGVGVIYVVDPKMFIDAFNWVLDKIPFVSF